MADHEHPSKKKRSKRNWMCYLLIIVSVLFVAWPFITWGILGIADRLFEGINFPETSRFGISGDMYGALNALFAGLAFVGFIYALRQQSLELQLQRRELSLQRRELKAQCREQERQANEFELQNKLMQVQRFESFFYQQISFIKDLKSTIQVFDDNSENSIHKLYINLFNFHNKIKETIRNIKNNKKYKAISYEGMEEALYESIVHNDVGYISSLIIQFNKIRPWIDSVYNSILLILDEKCLNKNQKIKYLYIMKNGFLEKEWKVVYMAGFFLNYSKIVNSLLEIGLFEEYESIAKISEDDMQFLQNEMKLKSNPSLESCEINL